ncbi:sensor histidine kinase [Calothrix sp. NIES-2098]|uniref:sensor histidine kinase n=1 Tax=Calothrix sp. NIES-2098 TaxID=1954171 RepID=UPI000B5E141E|nr:response regulator receiver signal transduction histidine kinase [Calothrix sp. NIES-2098]
MTIVQQASILVVDDVPTNIKVLFELLEQSGYIVSIAKSGESALEKAQSGLPDLILLDVMMPGIDGFETCRRLKANPRTKDIPVIFMTALTDGANKVKGLQQGAVDYITKPLEHEEVLARIGVHLELRRTRLQLIQEEKMASLGQLVAGIAHEINNPVNFIHGNIHHVTEYTYDLLDLLSLYQQHCCDPAPEICDRLESIDIEFLAEDFPKTINSMKIGVERIKQIVLSLKNFSRLDQAEMKAVDIHEGLESTLLIVQHRLKVNGDFPGIEIIRDYGELPPIECYAGQLNQVFMNILTNAIDALEELSAQQTERQHQIKIRTFMSNSQWANIAIADTGGGISEAVKQRIFDPFFTTKPVGKGTGLGMTISYQIITEKHGGKLECFSTLGKGSEFLIQIPVHQS